MKKIFKNSELNIRSFVPCISNPFWLISRCNVVHTDTNRKAVYIFGVGALQATFYDKNNPKFRLEDLAYDTLIKHLEKNPDEFETGLFRFEFDGQQFNFCEREPKWADYDCGVIEDDE